MNYREALERLYATAYPGSRPGLDAVKGLLKKLGDPQKQLKIVHCAGTNGKGSAMAFLERILLEAGYHTGRFVSPSLFCFEEQLRCDGEPIGQSELADLCGPVLDAVDEMKKEGSAVPTVFEITCALAFLWFERRGCDIALIEAGMGGAQDATNAADSTILAVLTSISLDHCQFLGDTAAKIAKVKAGIIKPGIRVCLDGTTPFAGEVVPAVSAVCEEKEAVLAVTCSDDISLISSCPEGSVFTWKGRGPYRITLPGLYQVKNAALSLQAVSELAALGFAISEKAVRNGLEETVWNGRFEIASREPLVILDGAHNPDAAAALMESVRTYFPENKIIMIFGVFSDKEYDKIIQLTMPYAHHVYTVDAGDRQRTLSSEAAALAAAGKARSVTDAKTVDNALALALEEAGERDVILVFGSLSIMHEGAVYFENRKSRQ